MAVPLILAMLTIVVVPCLALLLQSFLPSSAGGLKFRSFTLENYESLIDSRVFHQALVRTLRVSAIVTALTVFAGYPLALVLARLSRFWRGVMLSLLIFPFLLSAVVRAYGWNVIIGDKGLINEALLWAGLLGSPLRLIKTETAIIIGETHLLLPYMVLSLLTVLRGIDPNLAAAAQSLGARPHEVFFKVTLPMTLPGLITGTLLVFALAMTAFATPFMLGGTTVPVLTTLLYRYAFTVFDWPRASAIAVVLLVLGVGFMALHRWVSAKSLKGKVGVA